ncbi:hypothetical protein C8Q76DRAFT_620043, partial [Earliella scabrosa]
MHQKLLLHVCSDECPVPIHIFTTLRARRGSREVDRRRADNGTAIPTDVPYLRVADDALKHVIAREWQESLTAEKLQLVACAVCARGTSRREAREVGADKINLTLLRNDNLPPQVLPRNYNFHAYKRALLCTKGMSSLHALGPLTMCATCHRELVTKQRMPKLCLANCLYYGYESLPPQVREAFETSTPLERLLVARARASRICYRYSLLTNPHSSIVPCQTWLTPQQVRGNILVMPQNSTHLNRVLPPPPETIRDTVCAVFVGNTKPTKQNIAKLSPILARKSRVSSMAQFLVAENLHYECDTAFHGYSSRNLDLLFGPEDTSKDTAVPCAMDIGFLEENDATRAATADYTTRNTEDEIPSADEPILMENVGYTCGDQSPVSYRDMKFKALTHCLTGGRFVRSQAGDRFVPDFENPSLLTWLFPHLDPWGIGGFHDPNRTIPISMEEQLKYLMQLHNSPFERDADFAFVYFNILQKKHILDSVKFRVKASRQRELISQLLSVDKSTLEQMTFQFDRNPAHEPQTREERDILDLINKVGTVLHDLPGTSGYKLNMRNEIRGLVNFHGTPAFFITLNPSDVHNPLVRLFVAEDVPYRTMEYGHELTEWQRKLTVADHPGACARFFHTMISSFITMILRYDQKERGLFG